MVKAKAPKALCHQCPLQQRPFVPGKFRGKPEYILVGEAPGRTEARKGEPFVGESGRLLSSELKAAGLDPNACFVTNSVLCHPQRNELPLTALDACLPRLEHELQAIRKKFPVPIVALGAKACEVLTGDTHRGNWYLTDLGPVIHVYHPAYTLRKPGSAVEVLAGLAKVAKPIPTTTEPTTKYTVLTEAPQVKQWTEAMIKRGGKIAWDLETDQINWRRDRILCFCASWEAGKAIVIPGECLYYSIGHQVYLRRMFEQPCIEFVAHNGKFDVKFMRRQLDIQTRVDFDTMLAHYALDERTGGGEIHSLKTLVALEFDVPDYEQDLVQRYLKSRNDRYSKVPADKLHEYGAIDADYTLRLAERLEERMRADGLYEQPFRSPLMTAVPAIIMMEQNGVPIDDVELAQLESQFIEERDTIKVRLVRVARHDFNPRSSQQKAVILYDELGARIVTGRGFKARSTSASARAKLKEIYGPPTRPGQFLSFEEISDLDTPIAQFLALLDRYMKVEKLRSSYATNIVKLAEGGRVYPTFKLHGAETGRLSATGPAIQTIPRSSEKYGALIKRTYKAPKGWVIVETDYSQAELRVAAALSGDPFLIDVYRKGRDLHSEVAVAMFGEDFTKEDRMRCKMFNFSYLYGGNEHSFAADAGLPIRTARAFVHKYNETMPKLVEWREKQSAQMFEEGFVETPFGRRRRFPLILSQNSEDARKAAFNMPVQGSASDLTLLSGRAVYDWLQANPKLKQHVRMIITVHDSIVFEIKKPLAREVGQKLKEIMERTAVTYFPQVPWKADVKIGPSWGELEKI